MLFKSLDASDIVNPDRLGNTARELIADGVTYMDFTDGAKVGKSHRPWNQPGRKNEAVGEFYGRVFQGHRGEKARGWAFEPGSNSYRLTEREEWAGFGE